MPSHKQKRDRKRSHKHKRRNRSRSSVRKHNIQKKYEGKKENIPHNESAWGTDLRDISSYLENRREMIRQMFSSVGEDFLNKSVPLILKQSTREELKRTCLEELTRMSADVVFKILEGIPCDTEQDTSLEESSEIRRNECNSSNIYSGHTSKASSEENCCAVSGDCEVQELSFGKEKYEEHSSDERRYGSLESSSSEERQLDCERAVKYSSEDEFSEAIDEEPSTSYQSSGAKKLAKVAPFHITIAKPELPQPASLNEAEDFDSSELDNETSFEMIDLGLEEDIVDVEDESDSHGLSTEIEVPLHPSTHDENSDNQEMSEEEMQQNLSEMRELEHRARAIRSMLANIDRYQA